MKKPKPLLIGIALLLLAIVVWPGPSLLAALIRKRTVQVAEQAAGPYSRVTVGAVHLDLLAGDISWNRVRITQPSDSADTTWTAGRGAIFSGTIGSIQVRGLSLWRLLLHKDLRLRSLAVKRADLLLTTSARDSAATEGTGRNKSVVDQVQLDSLRIDSAALAWRDTRHGRPSARVASFNLEVTGIAATVPDAHQAFSLKIISAACALDSARAHFPPLYDVQVAKLHYSTLDSALALNGIALTSRSSPQDYGRVLAYETDLITFTMDSLALHRWEMPELWGNQAFIAGELLLAGTRLQDFRDKTMPDAPFKIKPLPARLLRQLPFAVKLDSLVVRDLDVKYNEKDSVTNDYGHVDFTGLQAVATGINTLDHDPKQELQLHARGMVYRTAPIDFHLRTALFDSSDHFSVHASIGALPFTVFNAMTSDLLLVRATKGSIGGIDYVFEADHNKGHGRVDMPYQGLKLHVSKRDGSREKNGLKSFLVNQLIKSSNEPGDKFRHGDLEVERVKDKQVFNYLWRGLREGMLQTVLPDVVNDARTAVKAVKGGPPK
jgi:hypothetical protein